MGVSFFEGTPVLAGFKGKPKGQPPLFIFGLGWVP